MNTFEIRAIKAQHILLIDDDELILTSLGYNLTRSSYRVSTASSAEEGLSFIRHDLPDLILLDIGLPGMNGFDALPYLKETHVPIIFLTAWRRDRDQILGLDLGADDYITKPFDLDILLARIKAVLRRTQHLEPSESRSNQIIVGGLIIDLALHRVMVAGQPLDLTSLEFSLLSLLASQAGRFFSVDDLLDRIWGPTYSGEPQVVYVHIHDLRQKLDAHPQHRCQIISERGLGYRLESPGS